MKNGIIYDRTWLEKARIKHGYTQTNVAKAAGMAISTYTRVEKGVYEPGVKAALRICDYLRVSPMNFVNEQPLT